MTPPSLNFLLQFVVPIKTGRKHCTIRALGKRRFTVGGPLYLYCKMRQRDCFRILSEPVMCQRIQPVEITQHGVVLEGHELNRAEREQLARACGMKDYAAFCHYWEPSMPFCGHAIWWNPPTNPKRRTM